MVTGGSEAKPESAILSFTSASPRVVHSPGSPAAGTDSEFGRSAFSTGNEIKKGGLKQDFDERFCERLRPSYSRDGQSEEAPDTKLGILFIKERI